MDNLVEQSIDTDPSQRRATNQTAANAQTTQLSEIDLSAGINLEDDWIHNSATNFSTSSVSKYHQLSSATAAKPDPSPRKESVAAPLPNKTAPRNHKQLPLRLRLLKTFKVMLLYLRMSRSLQFILFLFVISLILGILGLVFRDQLLPVLENFATYVKNGGVPAGLLYILLIIVTCFPPMTGYSMLLTLSGFIFGVGWGFLVNYLGAFLGGLLCFAFSRELRRSYLKRRGRRFEAELNSEATLLQKSAGQDEENLKMRTMPRSAYPNIDNQSAEDTEPIRIRERALSMQSDNSSTLADGSQKTDYQKYANLLSRYMETHPARSWKLLLLLRIAPYPYNIMNTLLAQIPAVTYTKFVIVSAVGSLKVIIHAWIGSTLGELADIANPYKNISSIKDSSPSQLTGGQIAELVILCLAVILAVAGGMYLYRVIHKALKEQQREEIMDDEEVSIDTVS